MSLLTAGSTGDGTPTRGRDAPAPVRTTAATAAALTCALTPLFLMGALADDIGDDLGFGDVTVGLLVTVFFVASALGAVPAGYITERVGARPAMLLGTLLSGLASAALGGWANGGPSAAAFLTVAGSAVGLIDTGAARAFDEMVSPRRQGLAFGIKEASVPAASMIAGAAVPLLGMKIGWRPTFGLTMLWLPLVWLLLSGQIGAAPSPRRTERRPRPSRRPPLLLALGTATGIGAATATAAFLVKGGVVAGLSPGAAGTLLAVSSALGIFVRLVTGHLADRSPRSQLPVAGGLLITGAAGPFLLAGGSQSAAVLGALVALGAGWGWTGLAYLAAVRAHPTAPAAAAGVMLAAVSAGGATGPLAFGLMVQPFGFPAAWTLVGAAMLLGGGMILAAHRLH